MDQSTILVLLIGIALGAAVEIIVRRPGRGGLTAADLVAAMGEVRQSMDGLRSDVQPTLEGVHRTVGQLAEQARTIESIGRDIASLQDILQPPNLRGALGELLLERVLAQVL